MFADLALARGDGRYPRLMRALGGVKLLILDDWGLEPLGPEQRRDLLEIVEERYGRGATLITSQIPVDRWHDLIGDPTLADAILDRVIHNAHRLQLRGEFPAQESRPDPRRLTMPAPPWRDHHRPAGDPPPRPTSIGTAGRLESEQVADINSECPADIVGIRIAGLDLQIIDGDETIPPRPVDAGLARSPAAGAPSGQRSGGRSHLARRLGRISQGARCRASDPCSPAPPPWSLSSLLRAASTPAALRSGYGRSSHPAKGGGP